MATLTASRDIRKVLKKRREQGARAFLEAVGTVEQRLTVRPVEVRTPKVKIPALPAPAEKVGKPTPEREAKAVAVSEPNAPPFNSQVLSIPTYLAKQLGPEAMMVLEKLYEVGIKSHNSRGMTSSYEGQRVDLSRTSYEHLSASERDAHEQFVAAMARMPPELQDLANELVLECPSLNHPKPRSAEEVGAAITGYTDRRRALGAVVAILHAIEWCVRPELTWTRRRK